MMSLKEYKDLQIECSILVGQIAETAAKAKLLKEKLAKHPDLIEVISEQSDKLEVEMFGYIKSIRILDQKLEN